MNPWEETWKADPVQIAAAQTGAMISFGNGACAHLRGEAHTMPRPMSEITPERLYERAKLMAAAPEMARLLLELGALPHHDRPPQVPLPVHYLRCESCGSEMVKPESSENHMDGCALVAVLRKAGVLP